MKTFFAATLALSMLAAPAIAAPRDNQGGGQGQHQGQQGQNNGNGQHQGNQGNNQNNGNGHAQNQSNDGRDHDARPQAQRQYSYNGRHYNAVRGPAWQAPRGHDARRVWYRGDRLPASYRGRGYEVDYRAYHLARPSYGYQWVRVGNNVYLVRASNGLVAQIVWNMFY